MGKTISEKIIGGHSGAHEVKSGDMVIASVDFAMGHDNSSPLAIQAFNRIPGENVFDPSKIAFVLDHSTPCPSVEISSLHNLMRDFARDKGTLFFDVGEGVCHNIITDQGYVVPGDLVVAADAETCTYGALNAFSVAIGATDLATVMKTGKLWFIVPETMKIICDGTLSKGVYSKDLILYIINKLGIDGCLYRAVEFYGEAISDLNVEERFTITNMTIEMGAKTALMEYDDKVKEWIKVHSSRNPQPVSSDPDAKYFDVIRYDANEVEPQVALSHGLENIVSVTEIKDIKINQGVIGTCTNGRLSDLRIAANFLEGKKVHRDIQLFIVPATKQILQDAINEGIVNTLVESGAVFLTPGCSPCFGGHICVPADGEIVLSTANKNYKGRAGNNNAYTYLASPATVAASAITGRITDPRLLI